MSFKHIVHHNVCRLMIVSLILSMIPVIPTIEASIDSNPTGIIIPMGLHQQTNGAFDREKLRTAYRDIFDQVYKQHNTPKLITTNFEYKGHLYASGSVLSNTDFGTTFDKIQQDSNLTIDQAKVLYPIKVAVFDSTVRANPNSSNPRVVTYEKGYFDRIQNVYLWNDYFTDINEQDIAGNRLVDTNGNRLYDYVIISDLIAGYEDQVATALGTTGLHKLKEFVGKGGVIYAQARGNYLLEKAGLLSNGTVDISHTNTAPNNIGMITIQGTGSMLTDSLLSSTSYVLDDPVIRSTTDPSIQPVATYTNTSSPNILALGTKSIGEGFVIMNSGHSSDKEEMYPLFMNAWFMAMSRSVEYKASVKQLFATDVTSNLIPALEKNIPIQVTETITNFNPQPVNNLTITVTVPTKFIVDPASVSPTPLWVKQLPDNQTQIYWQFDTLAQGSLELSYIVRTEAEAVKKEWAWISQGTLTYLEKNLNGVTNKSVNIERNTPYIHGQMAAWINGDRDIELDGWYDLPAEGVYFDISGTLENKEETDGKNVKVTDIVALVSPLIDVDKQDEIPSTLTRKSCLDINNDGIISASDPTELGDCTDYNADGKIDSSDCHDMNNDGNTTDVGECYVMADDYDTPSGLPPRPTEPPKKRVYERAQNPETLWIRNDVFLYNNNHYPLPKIMGAGSGSLTGSGFTLPKRSIITVDKEINKVESNGDFDNQEPRIKNNNLVNKLSLPEQSQLVFNWNNLPEEDRYYWLYKLKSPTDITIPANYQDVIKPVDIINYAYNLSTDKNIELGGKVEVDFHGSFTCDDTFLQNFFISSEKVAFYKKTCENGKLDLYFRPGINPYQSAMLSGLFDFSILNQDVGIGGDLTLYKLETDNEAKGIYTPVDTSWAMFHPGYAVKLPAVKLEFNYGTLQKFDYEESAFRYGIYSQELLHRQAQVPAEVHSNKPALMLSTNGASVYTNIGVHPIPFHEFLSSGAVVYTPASLETPRVEYEDIWHRFHVNPMRTVFWDLVPLPPPEKHAVINTTYDMKVDNNNDSVYETHVDEYPTNKKAEITFMVKSYNNYEIYYDSLWCAQRAINPNHFCTPEEVTAYYNTDKNRTSLSYRNDYHTYPEMGDYGASPISSSDPTCIYPVSGSGGILTGTGSGLFCGTAPYNDTFFLGSNHYAYPYHMDLHKYETVIAQPIFKGVGYDISLDPVKKSSDITFSNSNLHDINWFSNDLQNTDHSIVPQYTSNIYPLDCTKDASLCAKNQQYGIDKYNTADPNAANHYTEIRQVQDTDSRTWVYFQQALRGNAKEALTMKAYLSTYNNENNALQHKEGVIKINDGARYVYHQIAVGPSRYEVFDNHVQAVEGIQNDLTIEKKVAPVQIGTYEDSLYHIMKIYDKYEPRTFTEDPYIKSYGFGDSTVTVYVGGRKQNSLFFSRLNPAGDTTAIRLDIYNNTGKDFTDVNISAHVPTELQPYLTVEGDKTKLQNTDPVFFDFPNVFVKTIKDAYRGSYYFDMNLSAVPDSLKGKVSEISFDITGNNIPSNFKIPGAKFAILNDQEEAYYTLGNAQDISLTDSFPSFVLPTETRIANDVELQSFQTAINQDLVNKTRTNSDLVFGQLRSTAAPTITTNLDGTHLMTANLPDYAKTIPWNDGGIEKQNLYVIVKSTTSTHVSGTHTVNLAPTLSSQDYFNDTQSIQGNTRTVDIHGPELTIEYPTQIMRAFDNKPLDHLLLNEENEGTLEVKLTNVGDDIASNIKLTLAFPKEVKIASVAPQCSFYTVEGKDIACNKNPINLGKNYTVTWNTFGDLAPQVSRSVKINFSVTLTSSTVAMRGNMVASLNLLAAAKPSYNQTLLNSTDSTFVNMFTNQTINAHLGDTYKMSVQQDSVLKAPSISGTVSDQKNTINLTSSTQGVAHFNLYRKTSSIGTYILFQANGTFPLEDKNLQNGQEYFYITTAIDSNGKESAPSNELVLTPAKPSGGGGGLTHNTCVNLMCLPVAGSGKNECTTNIECTTSTPTNTNQNSIVSPLPPFPTLPQQPTTSNLTCEQNPIIFSDVKNHWAEIYLIQLQSMGSLFTGNNNANLFHPNETLSRKELAKWIVCFFVLPIPTVTENPFTDTSLSDPYTSFILSLKNSGIIQGYPDGTYQPDHPALRIEALKMIIKTADFHPERYVQFLDAKIFDDVEIDSWYEPYANFGKITDWVSGYMENLFGSAGKRMIHFFFRPSTYASRVEIAKWFVFARDKLQRKR